MCAQKKSLLLEVFIILSLVPYSGNLSVATVKLNIRKNNYYSPEFPSPINNVNIAKGNYSPKNPKNITQLEASDQDDVNLNIKFSIVGQSEAAKNKFQLVDGQVQLVAPVQTNGHFVLVVEAEDDGDPPRRSQCAIVVNVQDPSAVPSGPSIPSEVYTIRVSEGTPPDTRILKIPATDSSDSELVYSIASGNDNDEYEIDNKTGIITIKTLNTTDAVLGVYVVNDDGQSATTSVDIKVIKPAGHRSTGCTCTQDTHHANITNILPDYSTNIGDLTPINTPIFQIPVADPKLNTTFTIVGGNLDNDFAIDSTGAVRNVHLLNSTLRPEYILHIKVTDKNGGSSTVLRVRASHGQTDPGVEKGDIVEIRGCSGDDCGSGVGRALCTCFLLCVGIALNTFVIGLI